MSQQSIQESGRRRLTRNRIFRYIYDQPSAVSKAQIADSLGLSLPTIHQNINELLDLGLVRRGPLLASTGGRPPVAYEVPGDVRYCVGVSVTANHLRFLLTDLRQNEIAYREVPLATLKADDIGKEIRSNLDPFLTEYDVDRKKLLGVGITIPGIVDQETKTIRFSPTMMMKDMRLEKISSHIDFPVTFENDSVCAGFAEWFSKAPEQKSRNFAYLLLENGIGGSLFLNGRQYFGNDHRSGEFGHICVEPGGRVCNCGRKGCLEAYCSALRFTRDLGISIDEFFGEMEKGNQEYRELWDDVLHHLAIGIADLRMAFDCDITLGGFVADYMEPYLSKLKKLVLEQTPFDEEPDFISIGRFTSKASMMGVALHFTNEFLRGI